MIEYCKTVLKDTYNLVAGLVVTFKEMIKPVFTVRYPWKVLDNIPSYRGHIELVPDPQTGEPLCVACGKCMAICPSQCIYVETALPQQPQLEVSGWPPVPSFKEKVLPPESFKAKPAVFKLDFTLCSLCGQCVEVCPVGAIRFSTDYNLAGYKREDGKFDLLALLEKRR